MTGAAIEQVDGALRCIHQCRQAAYVHDFAVTFSIGRTCWSDKALIFRGLACKALTNVRDLCDHALPLLLFPFASSEDLEHFILCHWPHL